MRYIRTRIPQFVPRPALWEEEEVVKKEEKRAAKEATVAIAFVADLDRRTMLAGEDFGVWFQAAGERPEDDGEVQVDLPWLASAASFADYAVFLSEHSQRLLDASAACALACQGIQPEIFVGPFLDDAGPELDAFAGVADGFVIRTGQKEEASFEAEMLRRAATGLAERMMVERGTWHKAPSVCLMGSADVLSLVSPSVVEWALLSEPPAERAKPGGRLFVCQIPESKPWWAVHCGVVGPDILGWRPWMRDPRNVRGSRA